jgi:hypothetical protein
VRQDARKMLRFTIEIAETSLCYVYVRDEKEVRQLLLFYLYGIREDVGEQRDTDYRKAKQHQV